MLINFSVVLLPAESAFTPAFAPEPVRRRHCVQMAAFHFLWSGGCGAASPPIEGVGPAVVFDAAFGCEQGVGVRLNQLPTICMQALSTTSDPTGNPRFRQALEDGQCDLRRLLVAGATAAVRWALRRGTDDPWLAAPHWRTGWRGSSGPSRRGRSSAGLPRPPGGRAAAGAMGTDEEMKKGVFRRSASA